MGLTEFELAVVRRVPDQLKYGVLYVCFECNVVVHLCACGCGEKVVLPISPSCWSIEYDGEFVTMSPSVGNFQFPCHSHYLIRQNKVIWLGDSIHSPGNPDMCKRKKRKKHKRHLVERLRAMF